MMHTVFGHVALTSFLSIIPFYHRIPPRRMFCQRNETSADPALVRRRQIVLHHINSRNPVRKERDPVRRLIRIDRRCHHLLAVVHEHFRAEPVKDDSQL